MKSADQQTDPNQSFRRHRYRSIQMDGPTAVILVYIIEYVHGFYAFTKVNGEWKVYALADTTF